MARAGLTAGRITKAAADLADEAGFGNVTVSALARRFGVADASLYSHVRNLQELRTRVAVLAARELAGALTPAVAGRSGREALVAFAGAYRAFALAHPGRYAATQIQLPAETVTQSPGHLQVIETTYATLRAYRLAEPDLTDAVRLLRSAVHGFVSLESSGGFGHPRDISASWDRAVGALAHLLAHWPAAPAATPPAPQADPPASATPPEPEAR